MCTQACQSVHKQRNVSVCTRASSSVGSRPSLSRLTAFSPALIAAHLLVSTVVRTLHLCILCISTNLPPSFSHSPPSILSHTYPSILIMEHPTCTALMAVFSLYRPPPHTHTPSSPSFSTPTHLNYHAFIIAAFTYYTTHLYSNAFTRPLYHTRTHRYPGHCV